MSTAVISCCHTSPVFEPAEHVFDLMTLFIQGFGVSGRIVSPFSRRNAGYYSLSLKSSAKFIAVVTFITKQMGCAFRQSKVKQLGSDMIAHVTFTQTHDNWATITITNSMQFGIQTTFCAPDTAGNIPFLSRLLAVRWAFR